MMRAVLLLLSVLSVAAVGGCAAFEVAQSRPEARFARSLVALESEEYRAAADDLRFLYTRYPDEEIGRRALKLLIASELDPRNPERRPREAARLAAAYLRSERTPAWSEPIAETLYLLALELGGAPESIAGAGAEPAADRASTVQELPELPGPSVPERIRTLEREIERLTRRTRRIEVLEERTRELERLLAACEQELERIRKTLIP